MSSVKDIPGLVQTALKIAERATVGGPLWFRGINSIDHRLLPGLLRDGKSSEDVFEREKRMLTRFRQRSMAYWPSGYPQNDWEHLFAMQHYGMPTRLLDWSENLFVAAFFAFSSQPSMSANPRPAVWCLDPIAWNRSMPALSEFGESIRILTTADEEAEAYRTTTEKKRAKSPVALFGAHNSQRIVAQRGTFMIWGADIRSMEEVAAEQTKPPLWKIEFDAERDHLFHSLRRIGFGETMVFPELPYLAAELKRNESWR